MRPVLRNITGTKPSESTPQPQQQSAQHDEEERSQQGQEQQIEPSKSRMFSSPALLANALRQLAFAAVDRTYAPDPRRQKGAEMVRVMTDLLALSQYRDRKDFDSKGTEQRTPAGQAANHVATIQVRRSMMYASNINWLDGPDKKVAVEYVFEADSLVGVCEVNAKVAREYRRYDHERAWKTLLALLQNMGPLGKWLNVECEKLAKQMFMKM